MLKTPGIIFDLDGTLVDSVYQHVATWHETLRTARLAVSQWRIHRAIGMGGSLFLPKLLRDEGLRHSQAPSHGSRPHTKNSLTGLIGRIDPLPGAGELLRLLRDNRSHSQSPQVGAPRKRSDFSRASQTDPTALS